MSARIFEVGAVNDRKPRSSLHKLTETCSARKRPCSVLFPEAKSKTVTFFFPRPTVPRSCQRFLCPFCQFLGLDQAIAANKAHKLIDESSGFHVII
jgi:hypothetical protein